MSAAARKALELGAFTYEGKEYSRKDGSTYRMGFAYADMPKIWDGPHDDDIRLTIDLNDIIDPGEQSAYIAEKLPLVQAAVDRVATLREQAGRGLIDDGCIPLAENWGAAAGARIDDERDAFRMEEGMVLTLPISEAYFLDSMLLQGLYIEFIEGAELPRCAMEISFYPDYFMGHVIMGYVLPDGTVEMDASPQG